MQTWIKWTLWSTITGGMIAMQLMLAALSPQHAQFLKTFFWDFPIAIAQALVPGL